MRAIVIANGEIGAGASPGLTLSPDDLVIAANGGSRLAQRLGLEPQVVIGDLDSLPARLRARLEKRGCRFVSHPSRKDETDTELAIRYAVAEGAREIVLLGALGGRLDHMLANVLLLAMPELVGLQARIAAGDTEVWLLRAGCAVHLEGQVGDTVTLLPLAADALGITTQGLEYALHDGTLRLGLARGVSNVMTGTNAEVRLREGMLLVIRVRTYDQNRSGQREP